MHCYESLQTAAVRGQSEAVKWISPLHSEAYFLQDEAQTLSPYARHTLMITIEVWSC